MRDADRGPSEARRRLIKLLAASSLAGGILVAAHPTGADQITDQIGGAQLQRSAVDQQMSAIRAEIGTARDQEAALRTVIAGLDNQIAAGSSAINTTQDRLTAIDAALSAAQDNLLLTGARLARDRQRLTEEVVTMYKIDSGSSAVTALLESGNVEQFYQRFTDIRRIADAEEAMTAAVRQEQATVQADLTEIASARAQQRTRLQWLQGALAALDQSLSIRRQASAMLASVVVRDEQALVAAEAAGRQLDAEVASLTVAEAAAQAARRGGGNGHFAWPLLGPLTQDFGCTTYALEPFDSACSSKHFHTGIDIAPSCGTAVAAAAAGIAYTYPGDAGYGNHVIIVHGNGWVSVYGHLAAFDVTNGAAVTRGQTIGAEGSSGNSSGCHLHFEVRRNDQPTDPRPFLS